MQWIKKGIIFVPDNNELFMKSHAAIPFADKIENDILRIYFSSRNDKGQSMPFYIDAKMNGQFLKVLHIEKKPIFNLGSLGSFDDNGIMPSCVVNYMNMKYLYYIGWNPQVTVSYRLSIGLAISDDGGNNFKKYSIGPICDRNIHEPFFNTAPYVILENNLWRMWYVSCTGWRKINNYPEPSYHIKYAESMDGINWKKRGVICIDYDHFAEAIGRPCIIFENGIYKMWYSYRSITNYRIDREKSYRLGYAASVDGLNWNRKDNEVGIEKSEDGWDSEMIEYCHIVNINGLKYMFYNGNGFGKTGFGYAVSKE